VNIERKWTNEALKDAMDVVENGKTSLKKVNRHWNIHLTSLFNHLYGKIKFRKLGLGGCASNRKRLSCGFLGFSLQKVRHSISLQYKNESGRTHLNKANTFLKRSTKDLLVVLVQVETS